MIIVVRKLEDKRIRLQLTEIGAIQSYLSDIFDVLKECNIIYI